MYPERAQLGVDGNCGFALLGPNLQEGEAEFVQVPERSARGERWAAKQALLRLRKRLNKPLLNYWFGISHPYGD